METEDLIYRKLQKHLDRMPVGFPESQKGFDISMLQKLFTPEQARIALELSMLPENVERIYPRVKAFIKSPEELKSKLDEMYRKGIILGGKLLSRDPDKKLYSNAQFALGFFEFQLNRMNKNLAEDFLGYFKNDFRKEFEYKNPVQQMRTIPIEKSIIRENVTDTYENVRDLIQNTKGPIVLMPCVCRQTHDLAGDKCKASEMRETCIALESAALHCIEMGTGKEVSKDEIMKNIDDFEAAGFVLQPENNKKPSFICCCCGCCCAVLTTLKQFPKPSEYFKSNYYASVDRDLCAGCSTCADRCQMQAITIQDEKAVVDADRCLGCGLCTSTCKTGAVALNKKESITVPPDNHNELYQKILMNKIGTLSSIKTMVKYKLGMKV